MKRLFISALAMFFTLFCFYVGGYNFNTRDFDAFLVTIITATTVCNSKKNKPVVAVIIATKKASKSLVLKLYPPT